MPCKLCQGLAIVGHVTRWINKHVNNIMPAEISVMVAYAYCQRLDPGVDRNLFWFSNYNVKIC